MLVKVSGTIVDVVAGTSYPGTLEIKNSRIISIERGGGPYDTFIIPGLIDAHVHIESSMMVPSEFARLAVRHGTVATVSDPHEIANVMGTRGIDFMIENSRQTDFKFYFGAPSCVPATIFETSGASIGLDQVVVNRYHDAPPAIGFIRNIGLKKGAIAASVAHDSHNIVAAGVTDEDIARAVNIVIENRGGLSVVYDDTEKSLPLPVAGLMSDRDGFEVAENIQNSTDLQKA